MSITLFKTFACTEFDDGFHLSEQLTLSCDTAEHFRWELYAIVAALLYMFLVPCSLVLVLYLCRHEIDELMTEIVAIEEILKLILLVFIYQQ